MDDDVCPECGSRTAPVVATLRLGHSTVTRTWHECARCGWESRYDDTVTHDARDQAFEGTG